MPKDIKKSRNCNLIYFKKVLLFKAPAVITDHKKVAIIDENFSSSLPISKDTGIDRYLWMN